MNPPSRTEITARFDQALAWAVELHRHQRRKGSEAPYVAHLLGVSALVLEDGGDEDEAIAGLLHDAVEDHPDRASLAEISRRFGERVATMVESCTDTPAEWTGGPKPDWHARKRSYLDHLRTGPPGLRVSLADKLYNARAILLDYRNVGEALWDRFSVERVHTLWYYRALVDAFREAGAEGPMLDELARVVLELETLVSAREATEAHG